LAGRLWGGGEEVQRIELQGGREKPEQGRKRGGMTMKIANSSNSFGFARGREETKLIQGCSQKFQVSNGPSRYTSGGRRSSRKKGAKGRRQHRKKEGGVVLKELGAQRGGDEG